MLELNYPIREQKREQGRGEGEGECRSRRRIGGEGEEEVLYTSTILYELMISFDSSITTS